MLTRLNVFAYRRVDIWWLDWTDTGTVRCPIMIILGLILVIGFIVMVLSELPAFFREIGGGLAYIGSGIYRTAGWWGTPILAVLVLVALAYAMRRGYQAFAATPSGSVIVSHIKAWREQHCTVIELV